MLIPFVGSDWGGWLGRALNVSCHAKAPPDPGSWRGPACATLRRSAQRRADLRNARNLHKIAQRAVGILAHRTARIDRRAGRRRDLPVGGWRPEDGGRDHHEVTGWNACLTDPSVRAPGTG